MRKMIPVMALILAVMLVPAVALAASPWTEQATTTDKIFHKLDFGVKNLLAGWTEIFTVPWNAHKNGGSVAKGIGEGLWNALLFTGGGALHTVTFLLPQVDIPLKNNGVQLS